MAAKAKVSAKATARTISAKGMLGTSPANPLTMEERLHRIEVIGKRIDGYIHYICQIAGQSGSSAEVKERAVLAFYEQMVLVERQLGRIHDEMRLE